MVAQTAPAVRVAISETLGLAPGTIKPGQLVTGLKKLGFDYVFGARSDLAHAAIRHAQRYSSAPLAPACEPQAQARCMLLLLQAHPCKRSVPCAMHGPARSPLRPCATPPTPFPHPEPQTPCLAPT